MLTQSYKQKLNDLIYILGEKHFNYLSVGNFEMAQASIAAKSYVESATGKQSAHRTLLITSGTQYFNYGDYNHEN